jgi:hypothetical protein
MVKRAYPRKKEEERRIPVTLSLSGDTLRYFREALSISEGHEPTAEECKQKAIDLAYGAIGAYVRQHSEMIAQHGAIIV